MTAALRRMDHRNAGTVRHLVPVQAQSGAKVHVLVIEEVALVESADRFEGLAGQQHEHAGHPIRMGHPRRVRMNAPRCGQERLFQDRGRCREGAAIVFGRAERRHDLRRGDAGVPVPQRRHQLGKGIHGEGDVRIDHAQELAPRRTEGAVVVRAEAAPAHIFQDAHRKAELLRREGQCFGDIESDDHLDTLVPDRFQCSEQLSHQMALPMTDHRQRDARAVRERWLGCHDRPVSPVCPHGS